MSRKKAKKAAASDEESEAEVTKPKKTTARSVISRVKPVIQRSYDTEARRRPSRAFSSW